MLSHNLSQLIGQLNLDPEPIPSLEKLISNIYIPKEEVFTSYDECSIEYLGQKFYLTGSQFFKPREEHNYDWDFFTQYNPSVYKLLIEQGFEPIYERSLEYTDTDCLYVLRKQSTAEFRQIDIQLVQHCNHRIIIRNELKRLGKRFWSSIDKDQASVLWEVAHNLTMLSSPIFSHS